MLNNSKKQKHYCKSILLFLISSPALASLNDKVNLELNFGKYSENGEKAEDLIIHGKLPTENEIQPLVEILKSHQLINEVNKIDSKGNSILSIHLSKLILGKIHETEKDSKIQQLEKTIAEQKLKIASAENVATQVIPILKKQISILTELKSNQSAEYFYVENGEYNSINKTQNKNYLLKFISSKYKVFMAAINDKIGGIAHSGYGG